MLCRVIGPLLVYQDPVGCEVVTNCDTTRDLLPTCLGMVGQGGGGYVCVGGVDERGGCEKMKSASEYTWQSHDAKPIDYPQIIDYGLSITNC